MNNVSKILTEGYINHRKHKCISTCHNQSADKLFMSCRNVITDEI